MNFILLTGTKNGEAYKAYCLNAALEQLDIINPPVLVNLIRLIK